MMISHKTTKKIHCPPKIEGKNAEIKLFPKSMVGQKCFVILYAV